MGLTRRAKGQLPLANNLAQTGREWPAAELYWVMQKGVRMSGMPAWEFRISDEALWSLVAFMYPRATLRR